MFSQWLLSFVCLALAGWCSAVELPADNMALQLQVCNATNFFPRPFPIEEIMISKPFSYSHVFKSGGASIQRAMRSLYLEYPQSMNFIAFRHSFDFTKKDEMHIISNDHLLFTYLRNPLERVLSSFFELHRRNHPKILPQSYGNHF